MWYIVLLRYTPILCFCRNIVTATVVYNTNTVIDVEEFRKHFYRCNNVQMAQVITIIENISVHKK